MDNFDTESNHSYQSDSLQSNASSLSGLSFYGNEFAELRHLVNPSKYPTPYLERSSTPKAEFTTLENKENINVLKTDLQNSLKLIEQYKNDLQNLEKQLELKFNDKIDKLLRKNSRLEGELENANSQIERIIKSYKDNDKFLKAKEIIELEKIIHQLTTVNSSLEIQNANLKHEKDELDLVNINLKINLEEQLNDREIKNATIQNLKQKISEQHIELQNCMKNNNILNSELNIMHTKLQHSEKSKEWYKEQLQQCQNNKQVCNEEIIKYKNQINLLNESVSDLNIEISKYKNEVDQVRLQALKEKETLFKKLETINLNFNSLNDNPGLDNIGSTLTSINSNFYELTIEDLREELSSIKSYFQKKEAEFEKQKQENCELLAKCLVLQKTLQQSENSIEALENSKKELENNLQYFKENEKKKIYENLQLKNRLTELEIELKMENKEKENVENTTKVIRDQFLKFKNNHERVTNELNLKNKEILQLQNEKQELFMSNNWTICELEKIKGKDLIIENLKRDIKHLEAKLAELTQKIKGLEIQILKSDRVIKDKENDISEKVKELENYNTVILQYKTLTSEYENKQNLLQSELRDVNNKNLELGENFNLVKKELREKDLMLDKALKNIEQLKNDHKNALDLYKVVEEKCNYELNQKDLYIMDLENKYKKLENDRENYVKIITDDQKAEILLNHKKLRQTGAKDILDFRNNINESKVLGNDVETVIMKFFDNINMEELENTVDIRLKYLNEKVQNIKTHFEKKIQKLTDHNGADRIKELEILLQVKNRDMQDKQKRMDRNNRTLLRKVKEHMRGRNVAEKQLTYLQDMYNALADEMNTLKLAINSKNCELEILEKLSKNYKSENNKLRNDILSLEKDLSKHKICADCLDMDQLKEKLLVLEKLCKELEDTNIQLKSQLQVNGENTLQLTAKVKEQDKQNKELQENIFNLLRKIESSEKLLSASNEWENKYLSQNKLVEKLYQELKEKEKKCITNHMLIEDLNQELEQAKENVQFLSSEIKILSSNLQEKIKYSEELIHNKTVLENDYSLKNKEYEKCIVDLKNDLELLKNEIESLRNDKFFLQRLSNDLKVALRSYVQHNKILKTQLDLVTKEKQPFKSQPPNDLDELSISGKYNEKYIHQLMEENKSPIKKPVAAEIQGCLSKLRKEIFNLQGHIIKKNGVVYSSI